MRPEITPEVFEEKVESLCRLADPFSGATREQTAELWKPIHGFVQGLAAEGWTRGDIYDIAREADARQTGDGHGWEPIGDLLTTLTGDVAYDYILRLPGEPEDPDEFLSYVYGKSWRNSPPATPSGAAATPQVK